MGNQEIETKVQCFFKLHSHSNYKEKHYVRFVKKYEKLRQSLRLQSYSEVERLAHELAEHCLAISIDSQATVNAVTKELTASNKEIIPILPPIVDSSAAYAEEMYSAWACEMSIHDDPISTSLELTPSKEQEDSPSIALGAASHSTDTDDAVSSDQNAPDNPVEDKKSGRMGLTKLIGSLRLGVASAFPAPNLDGRGEPALDCSRTDTEESPRLEAVENEEAETSADDKSEDIAHAESVVSGTSEDFLPRGREVKPATAVINTDELSTVDTDAFINLIHVLDISSEDKLVAATNVPILRLMQVLVYLSFKKHEHLYQNLQHVALHFFSVLSLLPSLNKVYGAFIRSEATKEATNMESVVELSSGVGSILSYCEKKSSEAEVDQDQSLVLPERVFAIKEAIYRAEYGNNDDEIKETVYRSRHEDDDTTGVSRDVINNEVTEEDFRCFINDAVNDSNVRKHLSMGNQTNNLMTHVLNCLLVVDLLSRISILGTFQHLSKVSNLINSAKDFAQRANPEVLFDEDMTATEYLFTYVSPALASGDDELLKEAWRVACSVFVSLNKIVSVGPTANADTKANDPRKKQIITMLREVECRTINGEVDETADVYWSGIGKIYNDRRLRAIRTFACLFLRTPVQRSLPPGFFAEFGFTRSFLRLPASLIGKWSTFITPNFLSDCSHTMPAKYRKFDDIITKEVQASEDTGERTIFIQGNEQRKSLKLLLDVHDALVSGSRIEM
mmetsp:Transcript_2628/g.4785  ORF Transcript_2628/g.4785 Transcript_2628/m.4785 type:complete len:733 (-) Transcript_2628:197-2395(-)